MNICSRYPCFWNGVSCFAENCPRSPSIPFTVTPAPSPRFLPVNIPFSLFGVTVVTLDGYGNVEIKVDQPHPATKEESK